MEPYWDMVEQIVREADIVLEVLDARSIDISRNEQLETIINKLKRPRIFVVNKADLVDKRELEVAMNKLRTEVLEKEKQAYIVYTSVKNKRTIRNLIVLIKSVFGKHGKRPDFYNQPILKRPYREAKGDIVVGVVGYPNVGKSSLINGLSFRKKVQVSSKSGTTHGIHWISTGNEIKLIDTPGVIPLSYVDESRLGIISAKSAERIKDPTTAAGKIIEVFVKEKKLDKLESFYNFKISDELKNDPEANAYFIIEELAIAKKHLKKGGVADDARTSLVILKDWQNGRLKLKGKD